MEDQYKTKEQLINELAELRQQVAELETSEAERKRVEETPKESEAKFKSLFEGSHDAILLADPETGRFVDCNRKAEELSGYSRDEILSMKIGQFTPEDLKGEVPKEFQKLLAGKGMRKEWEIFTKDGNRMPVEISSTLISVGDKPYLQGAVRDITERKRAEEMLKKNEERFRASVEGLLDGFAIFSAVRNDAAQIIDFTYEYVNDAGCRLSQKTRDEMVGNTLLKVDPRLKEMGLFEEYVRVVETGQAFFKGSSLYEDLYGGGKRLTRAFDYRAVKLEDGFVLVWRDITSRKQTEESLRQSEERLRALVENSQDAVMMQDLDGRYLYYNGPARYGLTPAEVVGETPFDLFEPVTAVKVMTQLKEVISTGHVIIAEEKVSRKGNFLWLLDHKYPVRDKEGKLVAVGTIARDITKRKQAEEALQKYERLLRAFLSAIKEAVFVVDTEGIVVISNETLAERLGTNVNELIGACIYNYFPSEIARERKTQVDKVIRTGKPIRYEDRRAGIWIDSFVYPILDEEGKVVNVGVIAVDITERKRAEKEVYESESKYRRLYESMMDAYAKVDMTGQIQEFNSTFRGMLDYSDEELRRLTYEDLTPEKWHDFEGRILEEQVQALGYSQVYEKEFRRKHGTIFPVELRTFLIRDQSGQPEGMWAIIRDISDRRRAEKALQESEARHRIITDRVHDIVWQLDLRLHFVYVSPAVERVLGYTPQEACGLYVVDLLDEDGVVQMREVLRNWSERKTDFPIPKEYRMRHKDGHWVDVEVLSSSLFDAEGHPTGFVGVTRDISARKAAEEALRESEGKYRNLVESISDVVYTTDSSGVLTYISPVVKNTVGYEPDELIGRQFLEFVHKEDQGLLMRRFSELREGIVRHIDYRVIGKQGDVKWVRTLTNPIIEEGGFVGARGVLIDITERKRIDEALKKSEALHKEAQKTAQIGHWELDTSIMVPTWSEEIFRIFGLDPQKDPPSFAAHQKVTHPDDWNILKNAVRTSINEGIPFDIEFRILRPDKIIRWIHAIGYPKRDSEGRILSVFGTTQDITQRRESEDALRQSEERYRTFFTNSFDAVLLAAPDGQILEANEEACRIFGCTREELRKIGRDGIFDKSDPRLAYALKERERKGKFRDELNLIRKIGSKFPAEISSAIFKDKDGNLRTSMIIRDITERKRTEEEFKSTSEQLRALSAHLQSVREEERTLIAREIHDELGQALTALKMDLSWMNKKLPRDQKPLHEKAREMSQLLDTTVKAVKRISTELRPGLLDDLGIAAAIEWQAEEFQNRTGIKCNVTLTPEEIVLDEKLSTALFRIFQETLTNVARHSHATRAKVSLSQRVTKLELKVQDNGKGITERQIFGPKSLGFIGMRERVYPWGGKVKIEGNPGKGTMVTVTIPVKKE